jgi:Flp pilus assembly pilin Flp
MKNVFKRLLCDESGTTSVEYGILCALALICMLTVIPVFADKYQAFTLNVGATISAALP